MADSQSSSPTPEDMHWGISYLREDLQEVKQDMRDFRKEVSQEFANIRREMAQQFAEQRKEVAQQLRHNLMVMVGINGVFATIIIAFIVAFIEYRLPGG